MASRKQDEQTHSEIREQTKQKNQNNQQFGALENLLGANNVTASLLAELSKKISSLDSSIKSYYNNVNKAIDSGNNKEIKDALVDLFKQLKNNDGGNKKNKLFTEKQMKSVDLELNFTSAAKKLNDLKQISLNLDVNDKSTSKVKKIIKDLEDSFSKKSYSSRNFLDNLDLSKLDDLKNAQSLLTKLDKTAEDCGVSFETMGMKFEKSSRFYGVFNKGAESSFNYVKNLREEFDKCGAKTFTFFASLAVLNKEFKDVSDGLTQLMEETVEFRRNFQILSNSSKDMFPGGSKQLNDIRINMKLSREDTVKFAQIAQELRGTTYSVADLNKAMEGMRNTIGEVDIEKLRSLANVMKSIPKVQLDAFSSGVGNQDDVMNAIINMQQSGNIQEVLNLGASGALGNNFARVSGTNISDNDKAYAAMRRNIKFFSERTGEAATSLFGSKLSSLPLLSGMSNATDKGRKLVSGVGGILGANTALKNILEKSESVGTDDVVENTKSIANTVDDIHNVIKGENAEKNEGNILSNIVDAITGNNNRGSKIPNKTKGFGGKVGKNIADASDKLGKGIKSTLNSTKLTKSITGVFGKALGPMTKTGVLGLKAATKFLGPAGVVATVAMTAFDGMMNIEKDNAKAKSIQSDLGVTGSTNAYSFSGAFDALNGGKVNSDPKLLVNSLDSFLQGSLESITFGLYKESKEGKEKRQLDIAARTQKKYSVEGFKQLYALNKRINAVKEANIKRNMYMAQHYDETIKRIDAIVKGQFSMLETLNTQVSLLKMNNAYMMGLSNNQYSLNANKVIEYATAGFIKEQSEIDKNKQEVLSNAGLNETQRNIELNKLAEAEINIRIKLIENLKKAVNLENIPKIVENGFLTMINDSIRKFNSSGYMGSDSRMLETLMNDIVLAFDNFGLAAKESTNTLKKFKNIQNKMGDASRNRMDNIVLDISRESMKKILGAIPSANDLSVSGTWDGGNLTSYDLFGSNDAWKNQTKEVLELYEKAGFKFNDGFQVGEMAKDVAIGITSSLNGVTSSYRMIKDGRWLGSTGGAYENGTLTGTWSEENKNKLMETMLNEYRSASDKKDKRRMDVVIKEINNVANALKLNAEQRKKIDALNAAHNAYGGNIDAAGFKQFYQRNGTDYSKKTYEMNKDSYTELMNKDSKFREELLKSGLLKKDGSLDESKLADIHKLYSTMRNEVGKENSLRKIEEMKGFKDAIQQFEKETGKKYDSSNKEHVESVFSIFKDGMINRDIAGVTKFQQENAYNSVEAAAKIGDKESFEKLNANRDNLRTLFDEGIKNADESTKAILLEGQAALKKLTSGERLSKEEQNRLANSLKGATETLRAVNANMDSKDIAVIGHYQTLADIETQQIKTLELQTQVMKQLSNKYTDLIGKIKSLEQVVSQSSIIRLKELQSAKAQTDLTLTEWRGGDTGEASSELFKKRNEEAYSKMELIDNTLKKLNSKDFQDRISKVIFAGASAFDDVLSSFKSADLQISKDQKITDAVREMGKLASENVNETDISKQQAALDRMDQLYKASVASLDKKYRDANGEIKESEKNEYQQQLNVLNQVRDHSGAVVGSRGTIEGVKISLLKQRNDEEVKLVENLRQYSTILKKTKESLISFAKAAEQYKFEQDISLLKENLGGGDDVVKSVENLMDAVEVQYSEAKRQNQNELVKLKNDLAMAEENYEKDPSEKNKKQLIQIQAMYDTAKGKSSSLEVERMAAAAKAMRAGLEAITNKFALATESIDILRDRAENVAGTTEEWFKLENERLSLMSQEVQEMKNLIDSEKFRNLSEAEQQKLRNDLARKQLNFEKEKIGAQRNVFEKQLGAIVGGLQQSGAFKGMSKAAVFGAGHGINEADMAVQNRSKKVIGYTDRLALANNFSGDNIPVDRMAPHGDIDAAVAAHEQITGQSDRAYYSRKVDGMLNSVGISSENAKKAVQSIDNRIQEVEARFASGTISQEERDKSVSELNDAKNGIKVAEKVSKLSNDEVFKSILTYVIDIDELLKNGKIELTNGQQSFNQNGTGTTTSSSTRTNTTNNQQPVKETSSQITKSSNNSGERLVFKVGTSEQDLIFNERVLKEIEGQRQSAERGLERVTELLTRRGLTSEDKEKYMKLFNRYQKYLKESSMSNSDTVQQLRKQIKIGKELQEISKHEKIVNNYGGAYTQKEVTDAIKKLMLLKSRMSDESKIEYIKSKESDIQKDRDLLITKNKNSKEYRDISRRIKDNRKKSDEMLASLSGDKFMREALKRAQSLTDRRKEIARLEKGTPSQRAEANVKKKEYDEDNSSFNRILKSKGINRNVFEHAIEKNTKLKGIDDQILKLKRITEPFESQRMGEIKKQISVISNLNSELDSLKAKKAEDDKNRREVFEKSKKDRESARVIYQDAQKGTKEAEEQLWRELLLRKESGDNNFDFVTGNKKEDILRWQYIVNGDRNADPNDNAVKLLKNYQSKAKVEQDAKNLFDIAMKKSVEAFNNLTPEGQREWERYKLKEAIERLSADESAIEKSNLLEQSPEKRKANQEKLRKIREEKRQKQLNLDYLSMGKDEFADKYADQLSDADFGIELHTRRQKELEERLRLLQENGMGDSDLAKSVRQDLSNNNTLLAEHISRKSSITSTLQKYDNNVPLQEQIASKQQQLQEANNALGNMIFPQTSFSDFFPNSPKTPFPWKIQNPESVFNPKPAKGAQLPKIFDKFFYQAAQNQLARLQEERSKIEKNNNLVVKPENKGVAGSEDTTVQEPPTAMVAAYTDRRNKQKQAILNSPDALAVEALSGGNSNVHTAINTSGIDGNKSVDVFGNYQETSSQQGNQKIEVILKLDERVLAKQVVDIIGGSYNRLLQHSVNGGISNRPTSSNT